jgi:transaldolase/glucose-6-phosphate isomerase
MKDSPLLKLESLGQSIWLDFIRRGMISSGELARLIKEDGVHGVTSNPSIFEKAIAGSHDYDDAIRTLALAGKSVEEIYQALTVEDIQRAADIFRPVYDQTEGGDGFVSLEVSPHLAHDTEGTIAEAQQLWAAVNRPNVLIKVPATLEGLPAIQRLIGEGINVNVTLLFGLPRYRQVAEAYLAGLETLAKQRKPLGRVASVASFFLSRIDVLVDSQLEAMIRLGGARGGLAATLRGQVAIASAKSAYQIYQEIFGGKRFRALAAKGARTQRLLWASTSTKNPAYSDVKYVEALIGPETVNTVPLETLNAYRDHGNPAPRLVKDVTAAQKVRETLAEVGISLGAITLQLEDEGVQKFIQPFDLLMDTLKKRCSDALQEPVDRQALELGSYKNDVQRRLASLEEGRFSTRLWRKEPGLWKTDPRDQQVIRNALGWLHVAEKMEENLLGLDKFVAAVKAAGFRHVVHMGMGGSSLAPLVLARTLDRGEAGLPLTVLDTTDPITIRKIEREIPMAETLFIVASKSGTTAEPLAFGDYFYTQVKALKGSRAGENFVAITDPETPLVKLARERDFRHTFLNFADIGGRYSALSYFGLVPAALMGINVNELLIRALRMEHACAACVPLNENPGVALGAVMGELAKHGRDKVTLVTSKSIATLGMWLEQLLAESTGKQDTGLLPVASEPLGGPSEYGDDRVFIYLRLKDDVDEALENGIAALQAAGQPVVTIHIDDRLDLAQEFFRWEIATATAGSILGINAFDQPNVQESKDNTEQLLATLERTGQLPEEAPAVTDGPLSLYIQDAAPTLVKTLARFLVQTHHGDYVALMAYLPEESATEQALQAIRVSLRDRLQVATTVGYGPRFLHSTGQFHKGGSNTGLFLQLTADNVDDAPVPGKSYTFGVFKQAQALGDLEALRQHKRRVIRIHLGADIDQGLAALKQAVQSALAPSSS